VAEERLQPVFDPEQANMNPYDIELGDIDMVNPWLFSQDVQGSWFKRLRDESPVHLFDHPEIGRYWSVTRYDDIVTVDTSPDIFSSEPIIVLGDPLEDFNLPMFIAMDQPQHDEQRKVVNPVVAPANLKNMEALIRERTCDVLDNLPIGETFNWVDLVSIELTTRMLATLFDFPFEERSKLTYWSDITTAVPGMGLIRDDEHRKEEMIKCLQRFTELWNERVNQPPSGDLISMLAHGEATRNMGPLEYLGNLLLLIVGGNDTTRNSMTASVLCLDQNPGEFAKLKADHGLIPSMVSETIRWQTPLAYMRRTAKVDTVLGGQAIRAGDKVAMWYISGNRDERFFDNPDAYDIERKDVRRHLSFGFGIHRCMGNRLAEMQLKILWEEILARFDRIEVVGDVERVHSSFVHGYTELPVVLHAKA
jgi:cytochrome P450